jgi:uncharacterized membrane protein
MVDGRLLKEEMIGGWDAPADLFASAAGTFGMAAKQPAPEDTGASSVIERNIRALLTSRTDQEATRSRADRLAAAIGRFAGSMPFVYLHVVLVGLWIATNLGWLPFLPRFDPSFVILAMVASVEAIFLSTFVLITQNRMAAAADRRADLGLQISLLSEHEITRMLVLLRAMAQQMGVEAAHDPELDRLARQVKPEGVLEQIARETETHEQR